MISGTFRRKWENMPEKRNNSPVRPHTGLLILVGVCLFLLLLSSFSTGFSNALRSGVDAVLMPMQKGMNTAGRYVFERIEEQRELKRVQEVNELLSNELAVLREENARIKLEVSELSSLRELLDLAEQYPDYETVGAHIIGKNSSNWYRSFLIDKGSRDGISVNMNVLADGGLVGIVTAVSDRYATVSTIINDGQYVSAMSARTRSGCIVAGDLSLYAEGKLALQNIPMDADLQTGDMIVTSNISELYLPGLLIGYAETVEPEPNQLMKRGTIRPAADFDDLDAVLIITTLKISEETP